ncbi:ASCH domain-containing protein [Geminocystis sp. NIES-3709]|uniref:ASCH domain-containing protein n=1 Tax=Geminocystis sp. NIES-3709 TaxID=1617448 RepID=UPI0005FCAA7F|nr:ASCH domain-containing protein [Geminocystis sp. NIES-3709]BAQ63952.1 hypothetical protein GM3709_717 [Geminocystis sp. NIES-3709]
MMKVITIHQPWAWAIAEGFKTVENRTWQTNYRGLLAIHAGKSKKSLKYLDTVKELTGVENPKLRFGEIIAVVNLTNITIFTHTEWEKWAVKGQYHWLLRNPVKVEPIKINGQMGLWELNNKLIRIKQSKQFEFLSKFRIDELRFILQKYNIDCEDARVVNNVIKAIESSGLSNEEIWEMVGKYRGTYRKKLNIENLPLFNKF